MLDFLHSEQSVVVLAFIVKFPQERYAIILVLRCYPPVIH